MTIAVKQFGTFEGRRVDQFTLSSDTGVEIDIITYAGLVRAWRVPVSGGLRNVALGFDNFDDYPAHSPHFGALTGRVANRIGGARFTLDGQTYALPANEGPNILHGGPKGLGKLVWEAQADEAHNAVILTHSSLDGDMGFPGKVDFSVTYSLAGNRLSIDFAAKADRRTPINLVQHQYFNLGTGTDILDHRFQIFASAYTEVDKALIPTGAILPVAGTHWDLQTPRTTRDAAGNAVSYDENLVLYTGRRFEDPVAIVTAPDGDLTLTLYSDQPGVQFYNGPYTDVDVPGARFGHFSGFCLEDQNFPDAVNHPHFPSSIYGPDRPYHHRCAIEIG